jgi:phosphatidate cytidylyltransferase
MARLGNLTTRLLVAAVAIPLLLLAIYQDHHQVVWGVVFVGSLLVMHELFAMTLPDRADRLAGLVLGAAAAAGFYWLPPRYAPHLLPFLLAFFGPAFYYLFRPGDIATVAARSAFTTMAIVYGGLAFSFLALVKRDLGPDSGDVIVLLLATGWLSDTGGYFAGKYLGKRKLYPAVSPNKTWAGAVGGVGFALAGGFAFQAWRTSLAALTPIDVIVLVGFGSALGQVGDLFESLIKRSRGVKDSGTLLPGHGGLLDRVDAILFIAPLFYLYWVLRPIG